VIVANLQVETELLRLGGNKQDPYLKLTIPGSQQPPTRTKPVGDIFT
jgi:hypothetical protein